MLALLLESAARSLVLGGVAWLGLTFFRVRNPHEEMTAWKAVLAASLAMPLLVHLLAPRLAPWATVTIPAHAPLAHIMLPDAAVIDQSVATAPSVPTASLRGDSMRWQGWIAAVYVLAGGTLLLRMVIGIVLALRLIRAARPIRESWTAGCDVRISPTVSMPVTFGSTILLPADYINWDAAKRRAVLSHEKSHVERRDFVLLMLASLHCAIFWFNPLSWWLKQRIAELAEIISDDAAVAAAGDRHAYAAILADIVARAKPVPAGVAMARPRTVRKRIERLLTAAAPATPVTARGRLLLVLSLLPAAAAAAIGVARGAAPAGTVADAEVAPAERRASQTGPGGTVVTPAAQIPPTCGVFMHRLRNPDRQPSLEPLPTPRFNLYQPPGFANPVTQVIYDWPDGTTKTGVLSCFDGEFVLYRMQAGTAAGRQQNGSEPRSSRDLAIISAAIFAYTGAPPRTTVQLLLSRQPRRPNDDDVTTPLFGGSHMLWLQYDSFAIS